MTKAAKRRERGEQQPLTEVIQRRPLLRPQREDATDNPTSPPPLLLFLYYSHNCKGALAFIHLLITRSLFFSCQKTFKLLFMLEIVSILGWKIRSCRL